MLSTITSVEDKYIAVRTREVNKRLTANGGRLMAGRGEKIDD